LAMMPSRGGRVRLFLWLWPAGVTRAGQGKPYRRGDPRQEADMERTDWLDGGFTSIEAMFLMVTAITHHQFSSPIWGEDEVRKLHAELAEIALMAGRAVVDENATAAG
jgi:hypothetical protein